MSASPLNPFNEGAFSQHLNKEAEHELDPTERQGLSALGQIIEKRAARKLIQTWPGLFRLYEHPDGTLEAQFEDYLQERLRRLEEGVLPNDGAVHSCLEGLEAILASILLWPLQRVPTISDIPEPELSTDQGGSNILDIHRAAIRLFQDTLGAAIVSKTIQQTIAPRLRLLTEGTSSNRLETAESLKKSLAKAIDILAGKDFGSVLHRNKPLFKDTDGESKPIGVIALDIAKTLVEENRALPTKSELRARILRERPNVTFSDRQWPKILKEAGLSKLPSKVPFSK